MNRNLSIEALAFAADMHPTYVSTIERGHSNPSWSKFCAIAQALDLTVYDLAKAAEAEATQPICECCGQPIPAALTTIKAASFSSYLSASSAAISRRTRSEPSDDDGPASKKETGPVRP